MAENILHFGAVRMRVNGTGSLKMTLFGLDEVNSQVLGPFTMSTLMAVEPTRISNFNSQRAKLRVETTEIDEVFRINRIVVYVKEIYSSYPASVNA